MGLWPKRHGGDGGGQSFHQRGTLSPHAIPRLISHLFSYVQLGHRPDCKSVTIMELTDNMAVDLFHGTSNVIDPHEARRRRFFGGQRAVHVPGVGKSDL